MKALVLESLDAPPVVREMATPEPPPGEARVRVIAAALNRRDVWIRRGQYPGIRHPLVPGSDAFGVVDAVGDKKDAHWIGKSVVLDPGLDWGDDIRAQSPKYTILGLPRDGTLAEHVVVPVANLHRAPAHLEPAQTAALPLAGLTAWRALFTRAGLRAGEKVLIAGIGGGVATAALVLAKAAGAEVFVTSGSPEKIEAAKAHGAAGGALYTDANLTAALMSLTRGGFDVIIDGAGGEGFGVLARLLGPAGRLVFYGGTRGKWPAMLPQHLFYKQVSLLASTMGSPAEFAALLEFVARHRIAPVVDRIFPLAEGAAAFDHLEAGAQFGKVVLSIGAG
ncbi:MAG: zinc-binding dehydrogenase [Myxococcales bacterium]|nr:zinc-binding dehydrogenase [Myxococcales bacterium]